MKFKMVLPVLCAAMAISATASAADFVTNHGNVVISGTVVNYGDARDNNILYSVIPRDRYVEGGDLLTDSILFNGATFNSSTGEYSIPMLIKAPTNEYTIVLYTAADGYVAKTIDHISYYCDEYNDITSSAMSEEGKLAAVVELLDAYNTAMNIDHLAYKNLTAELKNALASEYLDSYPSFATNEAFNAVIEAHDLRNYLFENGNAACVEAYLADALATEGHEFNTPLFAEFGGLTQAEKDAIIAGFVGSVVPADFADQIAFKVFQTKTANVLVYDQYKPFIENENNIYGFNADDLTAYTNSANKNGILKAFRTKLNSGVSDIAGVRSAFAYAVTHPVVESVEGPANSGRPSSGGSTSTITLPNVPGPVKPSENEGTGVVTKGFNDLPQDHWAAKAVNALKGADIISGYDDETFAPNDSVTREQFIKMLTLGLRLTGAESEVNFTDVPEDAWYRNAVGAAIRAGITNGVTDTEFGVGTNITREQAAVMIQRAAKAKKLDLKDGEETEFVDSTSVSDYAKDAVAALSKAGIINGDGGMFRPQGTLTRAEAAKILYEFFGATDLI